MNCLVFASFSLTGEGSEEKARQFTDWLAFYMICPKGQVDIYVAMHHLSINGRQNIPTEHDMSKRLTTSAIIATLLLAATSFYSAEHSQQETTSRTVLMGG